MPSKTIQKNTWWKHLTLAEIGIEVIDGDRGVNYPHQDDFFTDGFCLFLSATNVTKNGFILTEKQFISENKDSSMGKGKLKKWDIVITTRWTIGNIAFYSSDISYENIRINSGMAILRNDTQKLKTEFLYKYLISSRFLKEIKRVSFGSAQPQLTIWIINKFSLDIPENSKEQTRIVEVLESWDRAIEALTKKIEIKKQIKKGLMQELLTGKTRLKGFSGKWETTKLGEVSHIKRWDSITKKDITDWSVPVIAWWQQPAYYHNKSNREGLTITVSWSWAYAGYVDFYKCPIFISDGMSIQEKSLNITFIFYFLKSAQEYIYSLQTWWAQTHVYPKDLARITLTMPKDKEEQKAIANMIGTADNEISTLEKKLTLLIDQKKYLLNNLIIGEIQTPENLTLHN